jgi:hypothetical protein
VKAASPSRAEEGGQQGRATLLAVGRRCSCEFIAQLNPRRPAASRVIFGAVEQKQSEGMTIRRSTSIRGPASSFTVDSGTGTVALRPPSPLSGTATFEPSGHGRGVWRSSIQVPLLGADPIDTGTSGFRAFLGNG